ncbi:DedA family protein [Gorillibacterium sp. CAU 1737]|uniref:DedA family protein n=1 Tax=Gorillibacterium sp. CAU 1737 TaxID=3140362 RepID=UPI003261CA85
MEMAKEMISQHGYYAITLLLALGIVGLPVPDETLMVFVGYLASQEILNYFYSLLFCFIGSITGMLVSYEIGKRLGLKAVNKCGRWIGLTPKRFEKIKGWVAKYGMWSILIAYFVPGVRHVAGYVSGITQMSFRRYVILCCVGAAIWTVLFVSIGYMLGDKFAAG